MGVEAVMRRLDRPHCHQESQRAQSPQLTTSPTTPVLRHNPIIGRSPPLSTHSKETSTSSFRSAALKHRRDSSTSERSPVPPSPSVEPARGENYSGVRRSGEMTRQGEVSPAQKSLMRHGRNSLDGRRLSSSGEEYGGGFPDRKSIFEGDQYEPEDDSGVIGRGKNSVEIAGTARDLIGAIWNVGAGAWKPKGSPSASTSTTNSNTTNTTTK
ncbi:hypothetical protein BT69DRAFT_312144 [Atractiella rhizophila]|nr:hypothetical protein BT69DRAFT_312144 [Atractiella rhizophila]